MKKSLADKIEQYIKVLIDRSSEHKIEIQRSELAETFRCVPSQVTYVINTRFTEKKGYLTESRRGGKGFVRIARFQDNSDLNEILNKNELLVFIDELLEKRAITKKEHEMLRYLVIHGFKDIPVKEKNKLFAAVRYALDSFTQARKH